MLPKSYNQYFISLPKVLESKNSDKIPQLQSTEVKCHMHQKQFCLVHCSEVALPHSYTITFSLYVAMCACLCGHVGKPTSRWTGDFWSKGVLL